MYRLARTLFVLALVLAPVGAWAQDSATIAGTVRDASGAVLPGVTVEASSSVLIEKVRSVTTNDTGQYSIVALPPGTYAITFTLPGFTTVRQENVNITAAISEQPVASLPSALAALTKGGLNAVTPPPTRTLPISCIDPP